MREIDFSGIARGFLLTLFVGVILPVGVLMMIPSSGIALVFVPFWTAGTILVFLSGAIVRRSAGFALGAVGCALSLLGLFTLPELARSTLCRQGSVELQPPSITGPTNVVFDDIANSSVRQFADSSVMLTLIKTHKVFEIERGPSGTLQESWQFSAEDFADCTGPDRSKVVFFEPFPEGNVPAHLLSYRKLPDPVTAQQPGRVSTFLYCLWRSSAPAPTSDAEAIIIRGSHAAEKAANDACHKIDVLERSGGNEKLLGSFRLYGVSKLMPAPAAVPISHHNWLNVIVRQVFGIKFAFETGKE